MYNLLSMTIGAVGAVMIAVNGRLSAVYDVFIAAVIIHIVGTVFSFIVCKIRRQKVLVKAGALWMYLGGAIGVFTTLGNNLSYGHISMTSIVALGLFGQTVTSLLVDSFGLLGMEKHPFEKKSLIGLFFASAGMLVMIQPFGSGAGGGVVLAVAAAFGAGISIVLSRTVNGRLAAYAGALPGSFINHLVGLPCTIVIMLLVDHGTLAGQLSVAPAAWWVYCGGMMGVVSVALYNVVVPKVPAFELTLLTFVAQVFAGLAIDLLFGNGYSAVTFWGGMLVAAGMVINMILERGSDDMRKSNN